MTRITETDYLKNKHLYPVFGNVPVTTPVDDRIAWRIHYTIDDEPRQIVDVPGSHFFFDGCHKIYMMTDNATVKRLANEGWDNEEFYPVDELVGAAFMSCPLLFIEHLNTGGAPVGNEHFTTILPQCAEDIVFEKVITT